jgi:hypothetical protein
MVNPEDLSDRELLLKIHERLAANDRDWFWFWRIVPGLTLGGASWLSWLTVVIMTGCSMAAPAPQPLGELDRTIQEAGYLSADASTPEPWAQPRDLLVDSGPLDHCPELVKEAFYVPGADKPPSVLD